VFLSYFTGAKNAPVRGSDLAPLSITLGLVKSSAIKLHIFSWLLSVK